MNKINYFLVNYIVPLILGLIIGTIIGLLVLNLIELYKGVL